MIILASPVYIIYATGSMKASLDHDGYRWMAHRPDKSMFSKQGVCVATAAVAGMKTEVIRSFLLISTSTPEPSLEL